MQNKKNIFNLKVNDKISLLLVCVFVVLLCLFMNATNAKAVDLTPDVTNVDLGTATQKDNFDFSSAYNSNVKQNYIVSGNNEYDYWVIVNSTELDSPQHNTYNVLNIKAQLPANNKYYRAVLLNMPTMLEGTSYNAGMQITGGWGSNATFYGHIDMNNQFISQLRSSGVGTHKYCYQCESQDYGIPSICSSKKYTYCPSSELPAVGCNGQNIIGMDCQFLNEATSTVSEFVSGGNNQIKMQITDNASTDLPGPTTGYYPFTILYFKLYKNPNGPTINASVDTNCQVSGDNKIITLHFDSITNATYYSILRDDNNDNVYEEVSKRTAGSADFLADYVDSGYNKNATVKYKIAAYNNQSSTVRSLTSDSCSTPTPSPTPTMLTCLDPGYDPVKFETDPNPWNSWYKWSHEVTDDNIGHCVNIREGNFWPGYFYAYKIIIPYGWQVKIFEEKDCGGRSALFTSNAEIPQEYRTDGVGGWWAYDSIYVKCGEIPVPNKPTLNVTSKCRGVNDNWCHQKIDTLKLSNYGNANIFYFYERKGDGKTGWIGPIGPQRGPYAYSSDTLEKKDNISDTEVRDFWGVACNTAGCSVLSDVKTSESLQCPCKPNISSLVVDKYCGAGPDYNDAKNTLKYTIYGPNWPNRIEIYRGSTKIANSANSIGGESGKSIIYQYEDNKNRGLDPKVSNIYYVRACYTNRVLVNNVFVYQDECVDTNKVTISACTEVSTDVKGVFIAQKIEDNTGGREVKITQDSHVVNNPPPGFNDLFAPLWKELVP